MTISTRDPASQTRLATETVAFFTPLGLIFAYIVGRFDPEMPDVIFAAIGALTVAGGSLLQSYKRNKA